MSWLLVLFGFLFLALMAYVIMLHRELLRIRQAAAVALHDLEDNACGYW